MLTAWLERTRLGLTRASAAWTIVDRRASTKLPPDVRASRGCCFLAEPNVCVMAKLDFWMWLSRPSRGRSLAAAGETVHVVTRSTARAAELPSKASRRSWPTSSAAKRSSDCRSPTRSSTPSATIARPANRSRKSMSTDWPTSLAALPPETGRIDLHQLHRRLWPNRRRARRRNQRVPAGARRGPGLPGSRAAAGGPSAGRACGHAAPGRLVWPGPHPQPAAIARRRAARRCRPKAA